MIHFVNPLLLLGLVAAALPVVAHLLTRRARRRVVFPTVRLLRESAASQSSLFRLRRWLLLALRCLVIVLLVLAFARPVWQDGSLPPVRPGEGASVVLVLDISASSAQQAEGVSAAQAMRAGAERVLATLRDGTDAVNIIHAGAAPRAVYPQFSTNHAAVRAELQNLAPTRERADLPGAVALAGALLREQPGQRRVVILSDMQRTNWSDVSLRDATGDLLPAGAGVTIVPVHVGEVRNAGLASPRAEPVRPVAGQPLQLAVRAVNHADVEQTITVEATVEGRPVGSQAVTLAPFEGRDVSFPATLAEPGAHQVVFALPADALAADNQAYLVVRAVRRVPVAVVADDGPDQPGTSAYLMIRALAPRGDQGDELEVLHLAGADVSLARLAEAEAVFVGYVGRLTPEALSALYTCANQGAGLVIFCGDGPVAQNLQDLAAQVPREELLPWTPGPLRDLAADGGFLQLGEGAWGEPPLNEFDEAGQLALAAVRFGRVWSAGGVKPGSKVLLRFVDGTPALGARPVGAGRLLVANFSPAMTCSDLGKYGSFVALMHSLVNHCRPVTDWRSEATVGEPMHCAATTETDVTPEQCLVIGPDGRPCERILLGDRRHLLAQLERPALPGFYRLVHAGTTLALASVNLDVRESDLRTVDEAVVRERLWSDGVALEVHGLGDDGPALSVRGTPLWPATLTLAMAVLGLELILLGVWKR